MLFRDNIVKMSGYVPGEQPREGEVLKLNTNENPYPPSPRVFEALQQVMTSNRLRQYPDPIGNRFREAASNALKVEPDSIIIGNGSDDILTMVTRATVPEGGQLVSPTPSYILYRTLADIQGARFTTVPFTDDWQLPTPWPEPNAPLTFVPNPNSPSGTMISNERLQQLSAEVDGLLVIDEAYVDFAETNALSLTSIDNVIVTRTLSKSYSLAGIRFGFGIARPEIIQELMKVKDSYNCDVLSLAAATAAMEDQAYLKETRAKILNTRTRLESELTKVGFEVTASHANFVWCRTGTTSAKSVYEQLKKRGILVRYMNYEGYGDGLRITVGTDAEIDRLLNELNPIMNNGT